MSFLVRLARWFSHQSFPRLFGVFFSNTHELEARLADRDAEITHLRTEIEWWRRQYTALTDSFLLSRGNRPIEVGVKAEVPPQPIPPAIGLAAEVEAQKLIEALLYDPKRTQLIVDDLTRSRRPADKEVLRRFERKLDEMPLEDTPTDGVVING